MPEIPMTWGRICIGTRLEKQVDSLFVEGWSHLISKGLREGDTFMLMRDRPAHISANDLIRRFLASDLDTLLFLDSDADFDVDFLSRFRDFEPGWEYDALQAFHTRRGWPPEAIWFRANGERLIQYVVIDEGTGDVGMVGTHCALFRRAIFERIYEEYGKGIAPEDFEWFCYPRHQKKSDEGQLSSEARALGFRLGATTAVKIDHISRVSTGWATHQEWLELSGTKARLKEFERLAGLVAEFTGEPVADVAAKALDGVKNTLTSYEISGSPMDGYLYELIGWNAGKMYQEIVAPLRSVQGARVLVIGAGLGSEAEILAEHNRVDVFELPGVLKEFCEFRLGGSVRFLDGDKLVDIGRTNGFHAYDLIVAIDVIEHIPLEQIDGALEFIAWALQKGGVLYCHNNFTEPTPFAYDHTVKFAEWCERHNFEKEGNYVYRKAASKEQLPVARS